MMPLGPVLCPLRQGCRAGWGSELGLRARSPPSSKGLSQVSGCCSPLLHGPPFLPFFFSSFLHPQPLSPACTCVSHSVLTRPHVDSLASPSLQMGKLRPERAACARPRTWTVPQGSPLSPFLPVAPEP